MIYCTPVWTVQRLQCSPVWEPQSYLKTKLVVNQLTEWNINKLVAHANMLAVTLPPELSLIMCNCQHKQIIYIIWQSVMLLNQWLDYGWHPCLSDTYTVADLSPPTLQSQHGYSLVQDHHTFIQGSSWQCVMVPWTAYSCCRPTWPRGSILCSHQLSGHVVCSKVNHWLSSISSCRSSDLEQNSFSATSLNLFRHRMKWFSF